MESLLLQVPGDGDRSGVEPLGGEAVAQLDDPITHRVCGCGGIAAGPPGQRLERVEVSRSVAGEQPVQVSAGDSVFRSCIGDGELFGNNFQDHDPMLRHATDCDVCRDSGETYHLGHMS